MICAKGIASLLLDAELFQSKLGKIPGAGNIGTELVNIVKSKEISNNQDEEEKQPAEDSESVIFDASG